ncbi:MAG: lamin tail domain-containing protein, partial [Planctomycetota bacterium]
LYADSNTTTSGIHLHFALDGDGEGVYLFDSLAGGGGLLDSVEFGMQINNYSIGRVGYERQWKLNQPTFGYSNVVQPLGDPATLKINEWLANEDVLFADDFIELFNPHAFPVDLGGLYLTDNPVTQPDKQEIPPLSFITGGGFAVFRADDRNRSGHVDFRLAANQEHIGLFDAELKVIDQVLYTPQTTDISQGRVPDGSANFEFFELPIPGLTNSMAMTPPTTIILVSSGATAYYYVPSDATSESTWMQPDFNDMAGWKTGLTSLGFGFGGTSRIAYNDCVYRSSDQYIGANVTTYGIGSGYSGPTSGPLLDQTTGDDTSITATLSQSGGVTWQEEPASGGSDCAVGTDAYNTFSGITDMTGVIYYGSTGWWVDLMFTGLDPATEYTFATSAARGNYSGRLTNYTLTGADTYTNASTSGVVALAENKVQFNTGDNYNEGYVARWTGITAADGSFTVRAEADPCAPDGRKAYSFDVFKLEGGFSGNDVQGDMLGINASLWSRIEFEVADPCLVDTLTLRMQYEDGFVAYLNGTKVAWSNFTGTPAWNSTADSNRPNDLATDFVEFDISDHISELQPGTNVLAVQGLNDDKNDGYFLMLPELIASSDPSLDPYIIALRLLDGLRITEIMYNTPATTSEYDYIELQNISDVNLDLTGVRFTEGIDFTFPPMQLEPGEYVVVDSNSAMFAFAYGTGINVAGEYSLELDNSGEGITLKLASPLDAAILRFGYDDRWYPLTDGQGESLLIRDPNAKPASWDKAESWYSGAYTPGSANP